MPRSGLIAEVGESGPLVALRADLDALPVEDRTDDPWASRVGGVAHACGHDVHATGLVGAGLALAAAHAAGELRGRVRLLFQPAEEVMPGGALELMSLGALDGVTSVFGLHCDPSLDVGQVGLREGPLTGAADAISVQLRGKGGHTSRPHLTEDLTFALGKLVTELPAILSRRLDPRAGVSVVWGLVQAGSTHNVIPGHRPRRRDRPDARRRGLGRRREDRPRAGRPDRRAVRRHRRGHLPARACRRWSTSTSRPSCSAGPSSGCSPRSATSRRSRASAARTSAGTSTGCRAPWGASGPARPAARRTTSTRGTCASTNGRRRSAPGCSPRSRWAPSRTAETRG